jgi:hypothetical protein
VDLSNRPAECDPVNLPDCEDETSPSSRDLDVSTSTESSNVYTDGVSVITPTLPSIEENLILASNSATYYFQNGVAGACGTVHTDYDYIAAIGKKI